ncbi:MAG: hypothetical protein Kow0069_20700 [Promethearchaeota archaeon]
MGFFQRDESDVAEAAVDFYSLGHVIFGQVTFWICYMLFAYWVPDVVYPVKTWSLVITIVVGIAWEPIENLLLWKLGLKFENKQDSWLNIVFDVIFVVVGGILAWVITIWWVNLILFIAELVVFLILRYVVFG